MTIRTSKRTVTFRRPFYLAGFDKELPAGRYNVETDEELLEGISFPVYRRMTTLIHLHAHAGLTQTLTVDPNDLDTALAHDEANSERKENRMTEQTTGNVTSGSKADEYDTQAALRAEDEGMLIHPR